MMSLIHKSMDFLTPYVYQVCKEEENFEKKAEESTLEKLTLNFLETNPYMMIMKMKKVMHLAILILIQVCRCLE